VAIIGNFWCSSVFNIYPSSRPCPSDLRPGPRYYKNK
jgi:hypothetical protein